jgi:hypothetical protein
VGNSLHIYRNLKNCAFTLEILKVSVISSNIKSLGVEGKNIRNEAKLRGRVYSIVGEILNYTDKSLGLKEGVDIVCEAIKWYAEQTIKLNE